MNVRPILSCFIAAILAPVPVNAGSGVPPHKAAMDKCAPSAELNFLCGLKRPEDLALLPGGRWIVASGMARGGGLHLVDRSTRKWERWIAPVAAAPAAPFDKCGSQPAPDEFQAHGVSVRDRGNGRATLYVVSHGGSEDIHDFAVGRGREAVDVFDIDVKGRKPSISWTGCITMPDQLVANSVVSARDGTIYATVLLEPGRSVADLFNGVPTGAVYRWKPGLPTFERMAGTELVGNNGIEVSQDGKTIYVSSFSKISAFTTTNPAKLINSVPIKGAIGDNIHWVGKQLITSGVRTDLCPPAAGGVPCMSGYRVSVVDPQTLALTTLVEGGDDSKFAGVSTALPVDGTVWMGSHSDNRIAYRTLP